MMLARPRSVPFFIYSRETDQLWNHRFGLIWDLWILKIQHVSLFGTLLNALHLEEWKGHDSVANLIDAEARFLDELL